MMSEIEKLTGRIAVIEHIQLFIIAQFPPLPHLVKKELEKRGIAELLEASDPPIELSEDFKKGFESQRKSFIAFVSGEFAKAKTE